MYFKGLTQFYWHLKSVLTLQYSIDINFVILFLFSVVFFILLLYFFRYINIAIGTIKV